ncbi:MAG: DUF4251 domain-containing protein [Flavobacteriaceae bacterium]|nr:DUF4251 domain-containing protein [Flavobacteriaceae bacterium]
MMKTIAVFLMVVAVFAGCTATKKLTDDQREALMSWGTETPFEIVSHRAMPMPTTAFIAVVNSGILSPDNSAGNINLVGNANFFRMKGDTINAYLPFFGERRFGGNYGSNDLAIEFDGIPEKKDITFNEKNQALEMRFSIDQKNDNEQYTILVTIFSGNTTDIQVLSSERSSISYRGNIKPLEK